MEELFERLKEQKVSKLAVMGGTFDPIHYGHLVTAETVREKYGFDRVIFMPTGNPPHKGSKSVTFSEHRFLMVHMATIGNPYFEVSRMEIDRRGHTYTIDTIKEMRSFFGEDLDICFITGADAVLEILTWKNVPELLSLCKFIAVTRPGYYKEQLEEKVSELRELFNSDIIIMDVPSFAISSTDIRERVALNRSVRYLIPENVEEYIRKNDLYAYKSE